MDKLKNISTKVEPPSPMFFQRKDSEDEEE
jgi:hypothetical protein